MFFKKISFSVVVFTIAQKVVRIRIRFRTTPSATLWLKLFRPTNNRLLFKSLYIIEKQIPRDRTNNAM
jgi:hypothetical protein